MVSKPGDDSQGDPTLESVTATAAPWEPLATASPEHPEQFGRYLVVEHLGAGGLGDVYRARDPDLDRDVAIKVMREAASPSTTGMRRLVREARAMAHVSHPNVIEVLDVGIEDGTVFVAMEFVDGPDLGAWLNDDPPPAELARALRQIALGLRAAHDAGLVHRDLKPANVLVGLAPAAEGRRPLDRIRVADFGLAKPARTSGSAERGSLGSGSVSSDLPGDAMETLTREGVVVGTPLYMPPEGLVGEAGDASGDIYALACIAYRAWTGRRPFGETHSLEQLLAEKRRGVDALAGQGELSSERVAFLRAALQPRRADRIEDIRTVLEHLDAIDGTRRPRGRRLALLVVGGAAALGLASSLTDSDPIPTRRCPPPRAETLLTPHDRAAIERALGSTPDGIAVWADLEPSLDATVADWIGARQAQCDAMPPPREPDWVCLDRSRRRFESLVDLLRRLPAERLAQGTSAVVDVNDDIAGCARATREPRVSPAVEQQIALADNLFQVGEIRPAAAAAAAAVTLAEATGDRRGLVLSYRLLGQRLPGSSLDVRRELLARAYELATADGSDQLAAKVSLEIAFVEIAHVEDNDAGDEWLRRSDALIARVDDSTLRLIAREYRAMLIERGGDAPAAIAIQEEIVETRRTMDNRRAYATSLNNLGSMLAHESRYPEALERFVAAQTVFEEVLGVENPSVILNTVHVATTLLSLGRADEAEPLLLRIASRPDLIDSSVGEQAIEALAELYRDQGRYLDSAAIHWAREEWARTIRGSEWTIADAITDRAQAMFAAGHRDHALELLQHGLDERRTMGQVPGTIDGRLELVYGDLLSKLERHDEALDHYRRCDDLWSRTLGPNHQELVFPLGSIVHDAVVLHRFDEAQEALDRIRGFDISLLDPGIPVVLEFFEGQLLYESGRDRDRGLALALNARDTLATLSNTNQSGALAEMTKWLEAREKR